ncbi:GNAT family N-acetyltransferase [Streptomyces sp. RFCAC02]|uniref:GNAT family N-acetyltransferase n=1 Tax=Streptomyces sp. RFCAC02 TaxID=2499143 RepID=UPI001020AFD1|nr:GNAT family N-acetyltransferase [Streptomyces sp. RFCAC02]
MTVLYEWRGAFANDEVEDLHAEGFGHPPAPDYDWRGQVERFSLGWVCARRVADGALVGFVNVAWDGCTHAFVLDTVVEKTLRRGGVGRELVAVAVERAREAGCSWLHVDFEDDLCPFYLDSCGFRPTPAGLIRL